MMCHEGCSLSFARVPLYARCMQAAPNPVLDRLEAVIADEHTRTEWWRERELIDDSLLDEDEEEDVAGVVTGLPEPSRVEEFFARYQARKGAPLPRFYFELLSRFHGIASGPMPSGASGPMPSDELGEAIVWPLEREGDHFMLEAVDLDGIRQGFVFGAQGDSGYLVFDAANLTDDGDDAPVYWLPRRFSSESPTQIAPSMRRFIGMLCEAQLHLPSVLKAARVPGWGV